MLLTRYSKFDSVIIFFCGLIFFTIGLRQQEIIGFESRFYLFALEMWRHGPSWFPTTYHISYPDYPVTATLLIYLTALMSGTMNKVVAVFPSAVAAALTLALTYLLGALHSRRRGWYAAGFLLFTLAFIMEARTISLDLYVTLFTALSFFYIYSAQLREKRPAIILIGLFLISSFAVRGPIGLVIPAGVICSFYLIEGNFKYFLKMGFFAFFLLLICTGILLSIAYHAGGEHLMHEVLRMEVGSRWVGYQSSPGYFYFVESIGVYAVSYPIALLVILGFMPQLLHRKTREMRFLCVLLGWILIIMIGLSIPVDKKIRYILPIAPALALICSYLFAASSLNSYLRILKNIFLSICAILPLLCLGLLSILYQHEIILNYNILIAVFIVLQMVILIIHNHDLTFFLAVFSFLFAYIFIVEPINLNANKTRDFVHAIEAQRERQHAKLVFYREGKDGRAIKYLADMPREEFPVFVKNLNELPEGPAFIITREENFNDLPKSLPVKKITSGKIGHDEMIVFKMD